MSPTVLRVSGKDFTNKRGETVHPLAMIHFCEGCRATGAPFGIKVGAKLFSYCGWKDGAPFCKKFPSTHVPSPGDGAPEQAPAPKRQLDRTA